MTGEMELENKKEEVRMPWQGLVLFFLICINIFSLSVIFISRIFWFGDSGSFNIDLLPEILSDFFEKMISFNILLFDFINDKIFVFNDEAVIGIFYFLVYFLSLTVLVNVLEKKKWAIYMLIFQYLSYIFTLSFFPELLFNFRSYRVVQIIHLIFSFFILYLLISCLKHSYFNQKKELKEK